MERNFSEGNGTAPYRVLEFYSGIGGMRYSLTAANVKAQVVEAFDINDVANDVYEHNFGHRPYQGNIQTLTADDLDRYGAHAWLLSPPCQPYTRQGLRKHSGDARAVSFLNILELIPRTRRPPCMLFVENVVGFEVSDTRAKMVEILKSSGFGVLEFILSPLQFGVPYSRPRYFCLAKRDSSLFRHQVVDGQIIFSLAPLFKYSSRDVEGDDQLQACEPIEKFLDLEKSRLRLDLETGFTPMKSSDEQNQNTDDQYSVPLSLIQRWGSAMDIVYPDSKRCCCFTKSYFRYVKGTGSLLATITKDDGKAPSLADLGLRFFTPREVANLHSFPEDFQFPPQISLKQRYALLGNSLSVAVVAPLLRYLFLEES